MITKTRDDDLCVVRINRPSRRNAVRPTDLRDLEAAIRRTDAPVVYLTGTGEAFCAGADFGSLADLEDRDDAYAFARLGQRVATRIERAPSVVVAGIDGPARGGGVELALACDIRIATPSASFAETGVDIGLFGAWGGTIRLPEVVGRGHALDIALSGRVLDAEEAHEIGLVSRIEADPRSVATDIATAPTRSLTAIKRLLRGQDGRLQQEHREARVFAELIEAGPELPTS